MSTDRTVHRSVDRSVAPVRWYRSKSSSPGSHTERRGHSSLLRASRLKRDRLLVQLLLLLLLLVLLFLLLLLFFVVAAVVVVVAAAVVVTVVAVTVIVEFPG